MTLNEFIRRIYVPRLLRLPEKPADPYADNWPDAAENSAKSYAVAIEAIRARKEGK
jgi:hypothetical protein